MNYMLCGYMCFWKASFSVSFTEFIGSLLAQVKSLLLPSHCSNIPTHTHSHTLPITQTHKNTHIYSHPPPQTHPVQKQREREMSMQSLSSLSCNQVLPPEDGGTP